MPRRSLFDPPTCDRCGAYIRASVMSRFNADVLCLECEADERLAPCYKAAHDAELAAVKAGDYNYNHGLSEADRAFLARRRLLRPRSLEE